MPSNVTLPWQFYKSLKENLISFINFQVGYDNLGLAIDYEFPIPDATNRSKNKADRFKISIPQPKTYTVPNSLATRLKNSGRNIKIYNRINIRIKPSDINTHLQHLVI